MLAENIMSLNPKFQIEVRNVEWKDYLVKYRNFMYPIFLIGWGADYADPHNFLYTFMHSQGVYGRYMAYRNPEVDRLCDAGIATVDPAKRAAIYISYRTSGTRTPRPVHLPADCGAPLPRLGQGVRAQRHAAGCQRDADGPLEGVAADPVSLRAGSTPPLQATQPCHWTTYKHLCHRR